MRGWKLGVAFAALTMTGCAWAPGVGGMVGLVAAVGLLGLASCSSNGKEEEEQDEQEGTYEACCRDGQLTTCYCPPQMACNYGQAMSLCGNGTCVNGPEAQCPGDGGTPDGGDGGVGGRWEPCCENGQLTTCYCPPMAACNYGLGLEVCDDGRCFYSTGHPDAGSLCQTTP